ncbi:hypothetical protein COV88_03855 [Candidatus Saccharibacteria bacterium CG11_big_fil_rev_8_21_14_0_20_41_19]|nr:MAG: hypothetical protein AUK57_02365 [Candidatus Saccharibacteria bacterium CG2_30_41_52]PIQ70558.1 MAG: hypothetical protein COV88_03855 [Candidatus Saccharibacteria bacterium CG11_big_fil_rev_8_21_14_0_20_41_19]PIZ60862.1 MAG: hypothetical protein COY18_00565 [Candidatus Saccharibacteria bacterium CG_4_10_14_0_2_um_filter_41_11]PJC29453.1 MAG: hypothetical protein CO052_03360 [Candidatus Saccharibacteria bacterium CG_4_9_14_0_2_um_filter_41_9]PJE66344.1 MAG: hypothetical protein COU92_008
MYIDTPKNPEQFFTPPTPIERSISEIGAEKNLDKKATAKKMASRALSDANIAKPNEVMSKSNIEDMNNDELANALVNEYKEKGGVEILFPDSSAEITNLGGDDSPNRNIAVVCKENSFPVLLEFRKPSFNDFDMDIAVEAQSYTDPKIGKEQLKKIIKKHKSQGYIITKANIGMPIKNNDKNINKIYGHLASELAEIVETSKHVEGMHVEVTEYDVAQINKKGGVVFATEIDEGGHFTSAKMNDEVIPSSFAYTHKFT